MPFETDFIIASLKDNIGWYWVLIFLKMKMPVERSVWWKMSHIWQRFKWNSEFNKSVQDLRIFRHLFFPRKSPTDLFRNKSSSTMVPNDSDITSCICHRRDFFTFSNTISQLAKFFSITKLWAVSLLGMLKWWKLPRKNWNPDNWFSYCFWKTQTFLRLNWNFSGQTQSKP